MSTVDLAASDWVRFDSTVVAAQLWGRQAVKEPTSFEHKTDLALPADEREEINEVAPPENFYTKWFGLWR